MQLRNGKRKLDAYHPTFDPGLDIATLVFSHVQCVKTRHRLALVSKLWRDASKPAAAYPLTFDFPDMLACMRSIHVTRLLDNDEALSLPYERIMKLFRDSTSTASNYVVGRELCDSAARRGSVRLLKWTREHNFAWDGIVCNYAAQYGHLPALQYLHENGCPWDSNACNEAAYNKHWDCLQYAVDNKCPEWEIFAEEYAKHLRSM
jgi:hypothetical protein